MGLEIIQRKEQEIKKGISKGYNEYKEFQGRKYTGMRVGGTHHWYYDKGEWKETKVAPDKWEFIICFIYQKLLAVELALAKAKEEGSVLRIKNAEDVYNVLADKEALEVLQRGLKEEHMKYKHDIVKFFMNMKDRIKVEDMRVY